MEIICLFFFFITEIFILDVFGKTISWINSICLTVSWENLMAYLLHHWPQTISMLYIFWWDIFLDSNLNITFTWCINQCLHLSNFYFLFPHTFWLINWISLSFEPWTFCYLLFCLWVDCFLFFFDVVNDGYQ